MNTHLHLLEAYTALLIAWPDEDLRACQTKLVGLILDRFFNPAADHFHQDFDDDWRLQSDEISYGHDLETCWLLTEVADLLGDSLIQARVHEIAGRVARATLAEAIDQDGAVFYQGNAAGIADRQKIWWAQAEAVVGFLDSFERSGDDAFLQAALGIWQFIQEQLVDRRLGEWRTGIDLLDTFQELDVKIGAMKGPYHNGRACMEIIARVDRMNSHQS